MHATTGETVQPCPECGVEVRTDARFTTWCVACDWNVDPDGPTEASGRLDKARRAVARRYGERLLADVADGGTPRAGRDASSLLAYAIACGVHGVTAVLLAAGLWCVVSGWGSAAMVLGLFFLLLAWTLRPRLSRLPQDDVILRRADAPVLYELLDEIALVAGTGGVAAVVVDAQVNASVTTYGVRGRRLLRLGLPMWEMLRPQERIALLGHELGHYSNGDTRRGLVLATAYRSLTTWRYYLTPDSDPSFLEMLVKVLVIVPRSLIQGVLVVLDKLTMRAGQRAEYLADSVAAHAGSTDAAVGLMDSLLVTGSADITLRREANNPRAGRRGSAQAQEWADGLWDRLAAHMASIPEHEYERQRRVSALRGHSVDSTHPPTHLRRECLLVGTPTSALVMSGDRREQGIASELAEARKQVARQIMRDGFDR